MRMMAIAVAAGVASSATACGDPLDVELVVVSVTGGAVVSPAEPGVFRITVSNPAARRVVWGMGSSSCQFELFLERDGAARERVGNRICTADFGEQGLDPGALRTEEIEWGGQVVSDGGLATLPAGAYRVVAQAGDKGASGALEVTVQSP